MAGTAGFPPNLSFLPCSWNPVRRRQQCAQPQVAPEFSSINHPLKAPLATGPDA